MKEYDERTQTSKASQRLERTDLLLSELRTGLRIGQVPEWPTLEQRAALADVEVALDAYLSFCYPHDPRH
jgi:hypothetical protein